MLVYNSIIDLKMDSIVNEKFIKETLSTKIGSRKSEL